MTDLATFPPAAALDGTEVLPGLQGGAAVKLKASDIARLTIVAPLRSMTAGRKRVRAKPTMGGAGNATFVMTTQAPADYDAIQLRIFGDTNSAANAFKASIAPSAKWNNGWAPLDASAAAQGFSTVTWGTTNPRNPRNPGGGAGTTLLNNATGTYGGGNLVEGYALSDIIPLASLARTDGGAKPLLFVRLYGTGAPASGSTNFNTAAGDPVNVAEPEYFCGYWTSNDYTATSNPGSAPNQGWVPYIEVIFYLRGRRVRGVVCIGDSIDEGDAPTNGATGAVAANGSAGKINGWPRQLVTKLNAVGLTSTYAAMCVSGEKSAIFHERLLSVLLNEDALGISHAFIRAWSGNDGYTASVVPAALKRTDFILDQCDRLRIVPILVRNWAGTVGSAAELLVRDYIDKAAASGIPVFDARALVAAAGDVTSNTIRSDYQVLTSSGSLVDDVHVNATAHDGISTQAFNQRALFGLG